jgi:hypothetical protein
VIGNFEFDILLAMRDDESMFDAVESLVLDLLEWVANSERSYDDRGLIAKQHVSGRIVVRVTPSGFALLAHRGS